MNCNIRLATTNDANLIREFILKLARYQKAPQAVQVTEETLKSQFRSNNPPFRAFIAELDARPVGFALFFESYSTWEGKSGVYLEDLYVEPQAREHGIGRKLLARLAQYALSRGFTRLEWSVLSGNSKAIDFYNAVGATAMPEWLRFRLDEQNMEALVEKDATQARIKLVS